MLFHSYEFIFMFLPTVLVAYHFAAYGGSAAQMIVLVGASLIFYCSWRSADVLVLIALMVATYGAARLIERYRRSWMLILGIAINLGTLAYFKYIGFFSEIIANIAGTTIIAAPLLPLGISFFVFQKIAYLVDTFRGRTVRHGFLDYALFVSFFPHS